MNDTYGLHPPEKKILSPWNPNFIQPYFFVLLSYGMPEENIETPFPSFDLFFLVSKFICLCTIKKNKKYFGIIGGAQLGALMP